jgi:hypothetical protein
MRKQILAKAFHTCIQSPQTIGSRRQRSSLSTHYASKSQSAQPRRPKAVAIVQSARRCSYLDFPRTCPTEVGRFIIIPSLIGRS